MATYVAEQSTRQETVGPHKGSFRWCIGMSAGQKTVETILAMLVPGAREVPYYGHHIYTVYIHCSPTEKHFLTWAAHAVQSTTKEQPPRLIWVEVMVAMLPTKLTSCKQEQPHRWKRGPGRQRRQRHKHRLTLKLMGSLMSERQRRGPELCQGPVPIRNTATPSRSSALHCSWLHTTLHHTLATQAQIFTRYS